MSQIIEFLTNSKEKELYELIDKLEEINDKIQLVDTDLDYDEYNEENGYKVIHADGYLFDVVKKKMYSEEDETKFYWNFIFEDTAYDGFKKCTIEKAIKLIKNEML